MKILTFVQEHPHRPQSSLFEPTLRCYHERIEGRDLRHPRRLPRSPSLFRRSTTRWQVYAKKARFGTSESATRADASEKSRPARTRALRPRSSDDLEGKIQRVKSGTLDPREAGCLDAERIPITQHVEDYVRGLEAKGCVPEHVDGVQKRLAWFLEETKITRLSQLRPSLVTTALKTLRDAARSDRTVSHYCAALKSFSRWAWKDRRTREDLLGGPGEAEDRDGEQAGRPVSRASRPTGHHDPDGEVPAWDDRRGSVLAVRAGDLHRLASIRIAVTHSRVVQPGRHPARSSPFPAATPRTADDAIQPLPSHVIPALRSWLATKPSMTPLFPPDRNSSLMIKADLKAAGIPADDFDFHGLRHCYVSQIVQTGASVKDAMELARHSDADLTFNRYAHTRLEELSRVVDKLPDLWEKCGKGDGLSVDHKSKSGKGNAIHQEPLTPDFPTHSLWEESGKPIFSHTLPTSGVSKGPDGTVGKNPRNAPRSVPTSPV